MNEDYFARLAQIESSNNPNARAGTSSATGLYQMTRGTFNNLQKSKPWLANTSWEDHASNPVLQKQFAKELTSQNQAALQKSGYEANPLNLYLAHFAGSGGANKLLSADPNMTLAQVLGEQVGRANPSLANKSVGELKNMFAKKLGSQSSGQKPWEMAWAKPMAEGGSVKPWEQTYETAPPDPVLPEVSKKLPRQDIGYLEGLLRSGLSGATMGWSDELIGRGRALTAPIREKIHGTPQERDVNKLIAQERALQEQFSKDNPIASTVSEIGGGLLTAVPAIMSGAGAPAAVANAARIGSRIPGLIKGGSKIAGLGAVAGAGTADTDLSKDETSNLGKRISGAQEGALTSLAFAPVVGALGVGGVKGYQALKNRFSPQPALEKAERHVLENLSRDQITPQNIRRQAQRASLLDTDARLTDVGGKNMEDLSQTLISKGSAGSKELADTMEGRIHNARENVANKINTQISEGKQYFATKEALDEARSTAAKPHYEAAYNAPPVQNDVINGLLQMEPFKKAYARAGVLAQQDAALLQAQYMQKIAQAGSAKERATLTDQMNREVQSMKLPDLTPENMTSQGISVKALDMVKRGIDDIQKGAYRPNASTVDMDDARALKPLKNIFLEEVDRSVPEYAKARGIAKGAIESQEAADVGRNSFMKSRSPDELRKEFSALDAHDKEYFRVGAKEALLSSIMNTSQDINAGKKIINNPVTRQKLEVLFDKPADFRKFQKGLEAEAENVIRAQRAVRGSQTQPRLASERQWDETSNMAQDLLGTIGAAGNAVLNPGAASAAGLVGKVGKFGKQLIAPKLSEQQADEAARMLNIPLTTGQGSNRAVNPAVNDLLKRLEARGKTMAKEKHWQAEPFRARTLSPLAAATGVTARSEPQGYVERAHGGLVGPLSTLI